MYKGSKVSLNKVPTSRRQLFCLSSLTRVTSGIFVLRSTLLAGGFTVVTKVEDVNQIVPQGH